MDNTDNLSRNSMIGWSSKDLLVTELFLCCEVRKYKTMGTSGVTADRVRISSIVELSLDYRVIAVASLLTAERNL